MRRAVEIIPNESLMQVEFRAAAGGGEWMDHYYGDGVWGKIKAN